MEALLRRVAAPLVEMEPRRLELGENLGSFGFESITLAELAAALTSGLEVEIRPNLFFAHSSLRALAEHLLARPMGRRWRAGLLR